MKLSLQRHPGGDGDAPALIIKVTANPRDTADLIKFDLAGKPFIRDLVNGRLVVFWEMTSEAGVKLTLRPEAGERFEDLEQLARAEFRYVDDEIDARRASGAAFNACAA